MARANAGSKNVGRHNENIDTFAQSLITRNTYRDRSTVWVTPSPDCKLDMQVVFGSWMPLEIPMNQKFRRLGIGHAEVADGYNAAVDLILKDSIKWRYMLTVEHDNLPPKDGLLKLYESVDQFDAVGGLYWMKGENGTAMIYGDPSRIDDFAPQVPRKDCLQECNGLGMGFTLFNVDMFRKMPRPWFKTDDHRGGTQDLHFFGEARKAGYRVACDTRIKVGHMDLNTREIW